MGSKVIVVSSVFSVKCKTPFNSKDCGMYLIQNPENGWFTFYPENPRLNGYQGKMEEDVNFDDPDDILLVKEGERILNKDENCLGRSKANRKQYVVFRSRTDCEKAGFEPLGPNWAEEVSWHPNE